MCALSTEKKLSDDLIPRWRTAKNRHSLIALASAAAPSGPMLLFSSGVMSAGGFTEVECRQQDAFFEAWGECFGSIQRDLIRA
jgi:hypothetical protein